VQTKHFYYFIFIFQLTVTAFGCSDKNKEERYVIGFSQCMTDDVWRQAMAIEMDIEASNHSNLTILIRDAKENNQLQIDQIKELINRKVDVLIISPNESDFITPIAVEAYRKGIPTIIVDRKINSEEYSSYVGGNSYQIGALAGKYASSLLDRDATILEVWGTESTSPAQERHAGFISGLDKSKVSRIISVEGKWRREIAMSEVEKIKDYHTIDLVYAHNDVMALGARDAMMKADSSLLADIKFLGVDGAFGKDAGLEAVVEGKLDASFLYPTGGDQVIKIANKIIRGEPIEKKYILNTTLINNPTAETLLMQANQLINYQTRITQQRKNMDNILNRFSMLQHSLTIILILMMILVFFAVYIFFINRKINKRNLQLRIKNDETERQKEQLITLNKQIKEVTDQKVRFFMNVSHEVKTPLTLIVSPLEKWIRNTSNSLLHTDLLRMKKNADRLTRVINQLLDFQRIERNDTELNLSSRDIVSFSASVKSLFDGLAEQRSIIYSFTTNKPSLKMQFDSEKIEKVLVNLLSNAFKFTPDNGEISMILHFQENNLIIRVEDNGRGIIKGEQPFVFDRFYTNAANNSTGTGIGLHLSQEFVKIHGGIITVESIPHETTVFRIELPINESHFSGTSESKGYPDIFQSELPEIDNELTCEIINKKYNYRVLVVEDDTEICDYLIAELSNSFHIIAAENGARALEILNESNNITLVLSDVLMPEMNGFDLCRHIKKSPELSDIPVILLTALSEIDQRIYGIAEGADDYIQKPFHTDYVKIKIIRLLEERRQLQKRFMKTMQAGGNPIVGEDQEVLDSDKLFLQKFVALLESSYTNSDVSIEKLSEQLGVSRVQLYRKIKQISGLTPVDYLRNFRMVKGVNLLEEHRYSISEIAYQTGFSSPAYFTKCFRDIFNMTPSEFLEKK